MESLTFSTIPVTDPRWYWKEDAYYWDGPDNVVISYLTRTFSECDKVLSVYSDEQVAQGLWFLIDNSSCNYALAIKNGDLPLDTRIECINSMATVFERYFRSPVLSPSSSPSDFRINTRR